jgi:hypothetical protein
MQELVPRQMVVIFLAMLERESSSFGETIG